MEGRLHLKNIYKHIQEIQHTEIPNKYQTKRKGKEKKKGNV
jgi:hypothetical protein